MSGQPVRPAPAYGRSLPRFLGATALGFVSQFLPYQAMTAQTSTSPYSSVTTGHFGATGWQLHEFAGPALAFLAIAYVTPLRDWSLWARHGHWLAVLLVVIAVAYGDWLATSGSVMGTAALGVMIWAALIRRREIGA